MYTSSKKEINHIHYVVRLEEGVVYCSKSPLPFKRVLTDLVTAVTSLKSFGSEKRRGKKKASSQFNKIIACTYLIIIDS